VQSDAVNTFLEFFLKSLKSPPDGGLTVLAKAQKDGIFRGK